MGHDIKVAERRSMISLLRNRSRRQRRPRRRLTDGAVSQTGSSIGTVYLAKASREQVLRA